MIRLFLKYLFTSNEDVEFKFLQRILSFLSPKYRLADARLDWLEDSFFQEWAEKHNLRNLHLRNRWMLYQLMRLTCKVAGDTAECGVYRGAGSHMMCLINEQNKKFQRIHHIFDSFEGLSPPLVVDGGYWKEGDLHCGLKAVKQKLLPFSGKVRFHEGWIPEKFADVENVQFSFVHIDVDLYEPTFESVKFFYPRMNTGGVILCDDYGASTCPGATKAIDEFLKDREEKMISLTDGSGFLIKGTQTSESI